MRWKIAVGVAVGTAVVLLPAMAFLGWQDRGEWFPMRVGDRWTYRDASDPERIVFEVRRKTSAGAFVVERTIGDARAIFVLSVTPDSVFISETSGVAFDPPFEEFRFPHASGEEWSYDRRLGERRVSATFRRTVLGRRRFTVEEKSSLGGKTTFTVERGTGVVRLVGKRTAIHASGLRNFDWTLERHERGG